MAGTVRYRLIPAHRLPYGPVSAYFGPTGDLTVLVDEAQMDPMLGPVIGGLSDAILSILPTASDMSAVRVHRDHQLGGSELVAADITDVIDVFLPHDLVTKEVAQQIGVHGTRVLKTFMQMAAIIGQSSPPPAA
jgi:hypothetical protein